MSWNERSPRSKIRVKYCREMFSRSSELAAARQTPGPRAARALDDRVPGDFVETAYGEGSGEILACGSGWNAGTNRRVW